MREYTVTAEDATAFAGEDIKRFADSTFMFQTLLQKFSFTWSGVRGTLPEEDSFYLKIRNDCDKDIYSI